jgi:hypothetical protein
MNSRLPDFYIIGAMKCATSTLHEQLARRGAFFMSTPKEPNFFNDTSLYPEKLADYQALFSKAHQAQIVGESSTHYTKLPTYEGTAERIGEVTPEARFVYVMRDPVERLVSHYIHQWTERQVHGNISEAVFEYPEYLAYSSYARQLKPFVERFGRARVLPVFFEYLVAHREEELKRIARFLGDESAEPFVWMADTAQTNVSKDRLRKSKFREAVLAFGPARAVKDALPSNLKERIKSVWRMEKRPELSETARLRVKRQLDEDLDILGDWLGLSLSCDNFKTVARRDFPRWTVHSERSES